MFLRSFLFLVSLVLCSSVLICQPYLVLETKGKIKGRKYPAGSTIKVHFQGEPKTNWETYTIQGFDLENNCIRVSETYCVPLNVLDRFDVTPAKNNKSTKEPPAFYVQWTYFQYFNGQRKLNKKNRLKIIDSALPAPAQN